MKERSHADVSLPNQNIILINLILYYFERYEKSVMKLQNTIYT